MNTQELLQPFCAVNDIREYLHHIFKKDDYLCASNGHVIVCVPDDGTVETRQEDISNINNLNLDNILNLREWPIDGFIPLEFGDPINIPCDECNSTGKVYKIIECDECDGEGEFKRRSHYYECKECDGAGTMRANSGEKNDCEDCEGTGIKKQHAILPDGRKFNYKYLLKLKALPEIVYLPVITKNDMAPMQFKFDNGIGMLMPTV